MQKRNHHSRLPRISVIVSTRNRSFLLERCLRSLISQEYSRYPYEIIVSDNASTDQTKDIVKKYQKRHRNVLYVVTKRPGISVTRNRGWRKASGEYIAFIDDDAFVKKDYIGEIARFTKKNPHASIFGGPFDRYCEEPIPLWFPKQYGMLTLGSKERSIAIGKEWITGTNMIVKKDVLKKLGGFDEKLTCESGFCYGEDTRLLMQATLHKEEIWYVPRIRVVHRIAPERLHILRLLQDDFVMGKTIVYAHHRNDTLLYHIASFAQKTCLFCYHMVNASHHSYRERCYYALRGLFSWAGAFSTYITK